MVDPKKRKQSNSGGGRDTEAGKQIEDLIKQNESHTLEAATLRSSLERLQRQLDESQQENAARNLVTQDLIKQLHSDNARLQEENKQLLAQIHKQQSSGTPSGATAGPMPDGSARLEQLLRKTNSTKLVVFTKGAVTSAAEVCDKVRDAASLPAHATVEAFKAGSVWIVKMHNRSFTLEALKKWFALRQLTGWGLDEALTKTQLAERASRKPRFLELKAAGAFPRWHGSEIYVRMQGLGVVPAAQWLPSRAVPPRPRGSTGAATPGAAATAAAAAPAAAGVGTSTAAAATAAPTAGAGSSSAPAGAPGASAGAQSAAQLG